MCTEHSWKFTVETRLSQFFSDFVRLLTSMVYEAFSAKLTQSIGCLYLISQGEPTRRNGLDKIKKVIR